jgi:hypothetical protein
MMMQKFDVVSKPHQSTMQHEREKKVIEFRNMLAMSTVDFSTPTCWQFNNFARLFHELAAADFSRVLFEHIVQVSQTNS